MSASVCGEIGPITPTPILIWSAAAPAAAAATSIAAPSSIAVIFFIV